MTAILERLTTQLQRTGGFMAGMVIPNIGAFMAWGLITALFIPTGWLPNPHFSRLVDPMILYLLPVLIGYSGGRLIYGARGGVVGAVATMGVASGSSVPMFIGAMAMGPLGGWAIRSFDRLVERRIPIGFEMLATNFSAGLAGMTLALAGYSLIGPAAGALTAALGTGAKILGASGLLPLIALVIEPGKVMFMNNAINHGVLAPLGVAEVQATGKSIFFLLETNPGPGLGLLMAYCIAGHGSVRQTAPGAMIIHFLGGIHEIYFPYVLMRPSTIAAVVLGGIAANLTFVITGAGLVATPSPGSVFAEIAMAPKGQWFPLLSGISAGALCSCLVALPLVRGSAGYEAGREELEQAAEAVRRKKAQSKQPLAGELKMPDTIFFVCEAGMGSSVIGRTVLKKKLEDAGLQINVQHCAVHELAPSAEIVVSHASLSSRVREQAPQARLYSIADFINSPAYDELVGDIGQIVERAHAPIA